MTPEYAINIGREALIMLMLISAPILVVGFAVGIVISLIQAVMQLHEITIAFVPKMFAMAIVLIFASGWMLNKLVQYTSGILSSLPEMVLK